MTLFIKIILNFKKLFYLLKIEKAFIKIKMEEESVNQQDHLTQSPNN